MLKPFLLILAAVLLSPSVYAQLGKIHVDSYLGQPLRAVIYVENAPMPLMASLASRATFDELNVDYDPTLQHLRFTVQQTALGPTILVRSTTPISSPYLSFVVQASAGDERWMQAYTVLLNPPPFVIPPEGIAVIAHDDDPPAISMPAKTSPPKIIPHKRLRSKSALHAAPFATVIAASGALAKQPSSAPQVNIDVLASEASAALANTEALSAKLNSLQQQLNERSKALQHSQQQTAALQHTIKLLRSKKQHKAQERQLASIELIAGWVTAGSLALIASWLYLRQRRLKVRAGDNDPLQGHTDSLYPQAIYSEPIKQVDQTQAAGLGQPKEKETQTLDKHLPSAPPLEKESQKRTSQLGADTSSLETSGLDNILNLYTKEKTDSSEESEPTPRTQNGDAVLDLDFSLEPALAEQSVRAEMPATMPEASPLEVATLSADPALDKVVDSEHATKLDLARVYLDMGDNEGAREVLQELTHEAQGPLKAEAEEMLSRLVT